ncbi:hypothetical protein GCM10011613_27970 [Cellvibrio zantedeschiae]|uniref:FecR protein domain-containing protein n=1 Tax=Cellvibrio zantedeschiae TaxID=1237077 RepID=A0ABQ3B775_9GAMM|nr:FecR family protein [Cellvibrio zantedeschiae]GGY81691.1 hypothetical protein GCM10011613_27970 [Cellvibrio zantedeschiae]
MQKENPNQLKSADQSDEAHIEQLIRLGGTRDEIDPIRHERVRQNLLKIWEEQHANNVTSKAVAKRKVFWQQPWALAASVVCLCAALFFVNSYKQQELVARITQVQGNADDNLSLKPGNGIYAGQEINTENNLLEISWKDSGILKVNKGTQIIFVDDNEIHLIKGAVYFDSHHQSNIHIRTAHGTLNDIGTQFETRTEPQSLSVFVREGKVKFENQENKNLMIPDGKALHLTQGSAKVLDIDKEKKPWMWADAMDGNINFDNKTLDNHTMADVLTWIAKREGWKLEFKTSIDRQHAERDRLHGQFKTTDSRKLLDQLTLVSNMRYQIINNTLLVSYL